STRAELPLPATSPLTPQLQHHRILPIPATVRVPPAKYRSTAPFSSQLLAQATRSRLVPTPASSHVPANQSPPQTPSLHPQPVAQLAPAPNDGNTPARSHTPAPAIFSLP